ncbi:MAG: hypothetical protein EAX87_11515 [Candidatus Thorarchaeota archaeon]|nr:hypothetical protein [Candidatus Thorarchaeota archaeon]
MMQGPYLIITIGAEFFLLAGFLFYLIFRAYISEEDRASLLVWISGLIGLYILGLVVSITLVAARMTIRDVVVALAIEAVDIVGLYLIIDDTVRISKASR